MFSCLKIQNVQLKMEALIMYYKIKKYKIDVFSIRVTYTPRNDGRNYVCAIWWKEFQNVLHVLKSKVKLGLKVTRKQTILEFVSRGCMKVFKSVYVNSLTAAVPQTSRLTCLPTGVLRFHFSRHPPLPGLNIFIKT